MGFERKETVVIMHKNLKKLYSNVPEVKQSIVFLRRQENVFSKQIIFQSDGKCIMKYIHTFALPQHV